MGQAGRLEASIVGEARKDALSVEYALENDLKSFGKGFTVLEKACLASARPASCRPLKLMLLCARFCSSMPPKVSCDSDSVCARGLLQCPVAHKQGYI